MFATANLDQYHRQPARHAFRLSQTVCSAATTTEHKEAATQTPAVPKPTVKAVNGVHANSSSSSTSGTKAAASTAVRSADPQDRSSKVASSSKKKLEDVAEDDDAASSTSKPKDAKRKASTSVISEADREDKRVRRNETSAKADDAGASALSREAGELASSRKDRRNGDAFHGPHLSQRKRSMS